MSTYLINLLNSCSLFVFNNVARLAGDVHVTVQNWLPKVDLQKICADRFKFKIKIAI